MERSRLEARESESHLTALTSRKQEGGFWIILGCSSTKVLNGAAGTRCPGWVTRWVGGTFAEIRKPREADLGRGDESFGHDELSVSGDVQVKRG